MPTLTQGTRDALAQLVRSIEAFDAECAASEHTDTDAAWELFHGIRASLAALVAPEAPGYRCAECKGTNVQHALWVHLNTDETDDPFGSWCHGDNSWCDDCEKHTYIENVPTAGL